MALPLFAALNALARRALPLIRGGVTRKLSSRAISDTLKKTFGTSIGRNTLLGIIRQFKTIDTQSAQLKFLPRLSRPNPNRLPESLTKLRRKYSFRVRVRGTVEGTDIEIEQFINISTSNIPTRQEMEDKAIQLINDNAKKYKIVIANATLIEGMQAGFEGFLS